ncbi:glycosyltransferase [Bifidobacterium callimiconis]|nr:glycosyltransferase [Bifidobacterium callimiconis]MBT1177303.1 glycosyltransferase [Bifidobacterium callimiconis]
MPTGLGGLETFLMNVYRNIDRDLVQFDFLEPHNEIPLHFEDEITSLGGNIYRIMYSQRESLIKSRSCLRVFFQEHPEIAGVHVNTNFPYAFPLKYAKKAGIKLRILHAHNCIPDSYYAGESIPQYLMRQARTCIENRQVNAYPTNYFACSSLAANYMFPDQQYTLIRNGIDTEAFAFNQQTRDRLRAEFGIAKTTTVIGFCGNFRSQKNPVFTLDVFHAYHKRNPDSILLMVGDGELRNEVERHIGELGMNDCVRLTGIRTDMTDLYQAMDAFLLPSLFEGLGIVYIEAQCAGLPTIAASDMVPQEIEVTDNLHFISLKQPAAQWAQAMDEAIDSAHSRIGYAKQVRNAGYDIRDVASYLQEFYLKNASPAQT